MEINNSALTRLNTVTNQLLRAMNAAASGKRVNRASDNPANYVSSKLLERDARTADVQSKTAEREANYYNTNSTALDAVTNLTTEIDSLTSQASSSVLSQTEKDALQHQVDQLTSQIDQTLQQSQLGSAADLGLTNLVINGSNEQRIQAANNTQNAFHSLANQNISTGSQIRTANRKQDMLSSELMNIRSSQSTIADADLVEESMIIGKMNILKDLSLQSINNSQQIQKSQIDLLG